MQLAEYENIADYYNFTVGLPFADKNNSFLLSPFESKCYAKWLEERPSYDTGRFSMGVDVGRRAHIVIGKKDSVGKYHVHYAERFKSSKDELLGERLVYLAKLFNCRSIVIDAMPDFTTAQYVAKKLPSRLVLACEYTKSKGKGKMANFEVDAENNLVTAYRTGVLTDYLKAHNGGDVLYPDKNACGQARKEIEEFKLNLKNLKKAKKLDTDGEEG